MRVRDCESDSWVIVGCMSNLRNREVCVVRTPFWQPAKQHVSHVEVTLVVVAASEIQK